jgi:hypothetical protein
MEKVALPEEALRTALQIVTPGPEQGCLKVRAVTWQQLVKNEKT